MFLVSSLTTKRSGSSSYPARICHFSYRRSWVRRAARECPRITTLTTTDRLGDGEERYPAAGCGFATLAQLTWVGLTSFLRTCPLKSDAPYAFQARTFGFWSLSAARMSMSRRRGPVKRFGFAMEHYQIMWSVVKKDLRIEQREDGSVGTTLTPFASATCAGETRFSDTRKLQKRFVKESLARIARAGQRNDPHLSAFALDTQAIF